MVRVFESMPIEIEDYIFHLAGPLTTALKHIPHPPSRIHHLIRRDLLQIEWRRDLDALSDAVYALVFAWTDAATSKTVIADLMTRVKSKGFHYWLMQRLDQLDATRWIVTQLRDLEWNSWWPDTIDLWTHDQVCFQYYRAIEFAIHSIIVKLLNESQFRKVLSRQANGINTGTCTIQLLQD